MKQRDGVSKVKSRVLDVRELGAATGGSLSTYLEKGAKTTDGSTTSTTGSTLLAAAAAGAVSGVGS